MMPISDLDRLLQHMDPILNAGTYVYVNVVDVLSFDFSLAIASIREHEGVSVLMDEDQAKKLNLVAHFPCAWITLNVHSDLQAIGLTAAFSAALGRAGISCNVVAGLHHDHIFVPKGQETQAMIELKLLQYRGQ